MPKHFHKTPPKSAVIDDIVEIAQSIDDGASLDSLANMTRRDLGHLHHVMAELQLKARKGETI